MYPQSFTYDGMRYDLRDKVITEGGENERMKHQCCSLELLSAKEKKKLVPADGGDNIRNLEEVKKCVEQIAKESLTKRQREILVKILSGQKQKEIAEELGINKSTVSRTYHRGLQQLEKHSKYLELFLR